MIKTWSFDYKIPTLNLTSNLTVIILSSKMLEKDSRLKFSLQQQVFASIFIYLLQHSSLRLNSKVSLQQSSLCLCI